MQKLTYKCKHCELDPFCPEIKDSTEQFFGVNLCQFHRSQAVTINGHLLSPESARQWKGWIALMERQGVAIAI